MHCLNGCFYPECCVFVYEFQHLQRWGVWGWCKGQIEYLWQGETKITVAISHWWSYLDFIDRFAKHCHISFCFLHCRVYQKSIRLQELQVNHYFYNKIRCKLKCNMFSFVCLQPGLGSFPYHLSSNRCSNGIVNIGEDALQK